MNRIMNQITKRKGCFHILHKLAKMASFYNQPPDRLFSYFA